MIAKSMKAALMVGTALGLSISAAQAASMAKSGMDKRIADLEREVALVKSQMKAAMTPKGPDKNIVSGNSRVRLTIYGQVNTAFRVLSVGGESQYQTVSNDGSGPRIGIRAVGKINPNLTIVGWHEVEWQYNRRSATGDHYDAEKKAASDGNERLRARHVDLSLSHKDLGTVSVGKGSIAGDAADLYSLSGTGYVFGFGGPSGNDGGFGGGPKLARNWTLGKFFGARQNRLRYQTPNVMGAKLEASLNENKGYSVGFLYSGAPPGVKDFRVLLRAGYRVDPNDHTNGNKDTAWGVSGGIAHSSGFNINGSYGTQSTAGAMGDDPFKWNVEAGWGGKVSDMGKTSITLGYGYYDNKLQEAAYYYVAVNQAIDAAAADVYAGAASDSGSDAAGDDRDSVTSVIVGARVKF